MRWLARFDYSPRPPGAGECPRPSGPLECPCPWSSLPGSPLPRVIRGVYTKGQERGCGCNGKGAVKVLKELKRSV